MRRFVGLLAFMFLALPLGFTVAGCGHSTPVRYCNGEGYGPVAGQVKSITLAQNLIASGESLNYGQIGTTLSATAVDCFNNAVSVRSFTYSTTDMTIADVNPATGAVCAGTWNRNTGGGIANFTVCSPPANTTNHSAFITAASSGATSNQIEVFIHPTVTGIVLGGKSAACPTTPNGPGDPATDCSVCNPNLNGVILPNTNVYSGNSCLSQNQSAQLVARVYTNGTTNPADNITCQVGPVNFELQNANNIASIDATGIVTANQPGSALVTATVSNSSSAVNAGFLSTCPPASITLSAVNQPANASNINVALNTPQAFTATVVDTNGQPINGLALEFNSTLPINFPTSSSTVTPEFPGSATITAACVPPSCNPAPFSQIGYLGNGTPVTSNGITVTAPGSASTFLYMASTNSDYIASENFNTGQMGSPVKLPFAPNSLVISQDGTTIYMGSIGGLMTFATATQALGNVYQTVQGSVLAVAPNNTFAVVTDPARQTVSLVTPNGGVYSSFNAVGVRAQWTPDSTTLYVATTGNQLLTYSTFTGWETTPVEENYTDVAVTVPNAGAYFAGAVTDGRSDCPSTTLNNLTTPPATSPVFSPLADQQAVPTDRLAYTTDGKHLLGATVQTTPAQLQDIVVTLPTTTSNGTTTIAACPAAPATIAPGYFKSTASSHPLNGITATSITGIVPSGNSSLAFVTYTGSGGELPLYVPSTGVVTDVPLSGGATTAPVAGVFSTDNSTFYAGTSGDNVVHTVTINGTAATDSGIITPNLPGINGGTATPNLIVQRPLRAQS